MIVLNWHAEADCHVCCLRQVDTFRFVSSRHAICYPRSFFLILHVHKPCLLRTEHGDAESPSVPINTLCRCLYNNSVIDFATTRAANSDSAYRNGTPALFLLASVTSSYLCGSSRMISTWPRLTYFLLPIIDNSCLIY